MSGGLLIVTTAETCGDGASVAVAVIVTVFPAGTLAGALYVVEAPLSVCVGVNEPQAPTEPQVTVQSTPPLPGSFDTVALTLSVPPAVAEAGSAGVNAMLSALAETVIVVRVRYCWLLTVIVAAFV